MNSTLKSNNKYKTSMKYVKPLMKLLYLFIFIPGLQAQIYAPEGLNMPGSWDGWTNPPGNKAFAGEAQTGGGRVVLIPLGTPLYQTIFHTGQNGDVQAGNYQFKFTSGPLSNIWQNQWGDVDFTVNTIEELHYGVAGTGEPDPNTISLSDDKWYVANWNNTGYNNTLALFMELSNQPVEIVDVQQSPSVPRRNDTVTISLITSASPSPEEKIFLRYSTDGWQTSCTVPVLLNENSGTASIDPMPVNTTVNYYLFTTVFNNPGEPFDLITIRYNNNGGVNYEYTVADTLSCGSSLSLISTDPPFPFDTSAVTVTFNALLGNGGLAGYNDTVYAHTGVITSESSNSHDWKHVKTEWGENTPETRMTLIDSNLYELYIPNIRQYYGVDDNEEVLKLAFVFRSKEPVNGGFLEGKTAAPDDIFTTVYKNSLNVKITYPPKNNLIDPQSLIPVCVSSLQSDSILLFLDDSILSKTGELSMFYTLDPSGIAPGTHWLVAEGINTGNEVFDSVPVYIRGPVPVAELPNGLKNGINYINDTTVTLVLHDPPALKKYVFVIGDMNGWAPSDKGYMYRTPDGQHYWITLTGLTPRKEYAYQYFIDGKLKLADPYCDKILDPYNDKWIPDDIYPDLKPYPFDQTTGNVSIFQTAQTPFVWQVENFVPAATGEHQSDLIIYELLVRDFVNDRHITTVTDTLDYLKSLGINAIELMPFNEFEGNDSWGYNPDFYFAPDKAYGTKDDYKNFIDACHQKGIAVIMDIALNHSFGQSPMAQMYWNKEMNRPSAQNPWYNEVAPHPLSPGSDFNHESPYTKNFCKRIFKYWIDEYKIDGYRFDLSKGFTQTYSGQDLSEWSKYDASRIAILTGYYNAIKTYNPNAYVILEHLSENDEERVLANTGMLPWGKMTDNFNQATMGYQNNSDFSWAYYTERGYTYPNLIPFMESHDEERLMFKNISYGNSSGTYNIKDTVTALKRIEAAASLYFMIPGPKMLWQFEELGYDYSINSCPGDTVNEICRTWSKPVRWDYWNQPQRQHLYQLFAAMAKLKTEQQAFEQGTFTKDLSGLTKRAWLNHSSLNVCAGANFDVVNKTIYPAFQHTGTWYNYFTGETLNVDNAGGYSINVEPGGYYLFTDKKLNRPFVNCTFEVIKDETGTGVNNVDIDLAPYGTHTTGANGTTFFTPSSNHNYLFKVHKDGYVDTTGTINVQQQDITVKIVLHSNGNAELKKEEVTVYPNPANNFINIKTGKYFTLTVTGILGDTFLKTSLKKGINTLNVSGLPPGIYLFKLKGKNNNIIKKILIK